MVELRNEAGKSLPKITRKSRFILYHSRYHMVGAGTAEPITSGGSRTA